VKKLPAILYIRSNSHTDIRTFGFSEVCAEALVNSDGPVEIGTYRLMKVNHYKRITVLAEQQPRPAPPSRSVKRSGASGKR
jgi:hypothetical protein